MNLLLDTHILVWAAYEPARLSDAARRMLSDPTNALHFSVASLWEVAIKSALGRPDFAVDVAELRLGLVANDYNELTVESAHVLRLPTLPPLHADPFDRILLAQAMAEGHVLLTADAKVLAYGGPVRAV
jgi:PIN domain nuclease of toxin-antitoxin system